MIITCPTCEKRVNLPDGNKTHLQLAAVKCGGCGGEVPLKKTLSAPRGWPAPGIRCAIVSAGKRLRFFSLPSVVSFHPERCRPR